MMQNESRFEYVLTTLINVLFHFVFRHICQDTSIVLPSACSTAIGPVCKFNFTIYVASKCRLHNCVIHHCPVYLL
jgi:hypothetical protein